MITFYYLLVLAALVLCLAGEQIRVNRWIWLLLMGIGLVLIAGLKGRNVSVDDHVFMDFYRNAMPLYMLILQPGAFFQADSVEPTFLLFSSLMKFIFPYDTGYSILIFLFALGAVSLKLKAIHDYSEFAFFSLLIYVCDYFLLHEIVQVRAGLAAAIAMMSFRYIISRDLGKFAAVILLATLFHYSAIIFFPFYFLSTKSINPLTYMAVIVVPYLMMKAGVDPITLLSKYDLGVYSEKIRIYQAEQFYKGFKINEMNATLLFQLLLSGFLLYYRRELPDKSPYGILFLKINMVSVGVFYLFMPLAVFAFRLWEMLNVVLIFLIPQLIYFIKPRWLPELITVLVALALFGNIVMQGYLRPYTLVF
ncbi:MAG: EpsG family protein [Bacteroidales bacterium]|nr:EpsG family protein [Bacteroidales bacterium]